jgi:hypothetical protein
MSPGVKRDAMVFLDAGLCFCFTQLVATADKQLIRLDIFTLTIFLLLWDVYTQNQPSFYVSPPKTS